MSWGRSHIGFTQIDGVAHYVYEWHKSERIFWDTQCGIEWGHRNNRDTIYRPKIHKHLHPTCLACITYQASVECKDYPSIGGPRWPK